MKFNSFKNNIFLLPRKLTSLITILSDLPSIYKLSKFQQKPVPAVSNPSNEPHLFFGLALFASLSVAIEAKHHVTRGEVLQAINNDRAMYTNKTQIGNMNELVYDMKLEVIAKEELKKQRGCIEKIMTPLDENLELFKVVSSDSDEGNSDYLTFGTGRTKMAIATGKCEKDQEHEDLYFIVDVDPNTPMLPGKPGSRCPKDRPFNNNGLCATSKGYVRKGQANKGDAKKFANWISYER